MLRFHSIERFTTYDKVILAGALAMAAGTFFPIVRLPLLGTINYLARGHGDGTIVLVLSGIVVAAVFYGYRRIAALVGFAALVVMTITLLKILDVLSKLHRETTHNPFATLLLNNGGLEWGWLPLIGGALAVIVGGVAMYSGELAEKAAGAQTDDDDRTRDIAKKIACYVQESAQRSTTAGQASRTTSSPGFGRRRFSRLAR